MNYLYNDKGPLGAGIIKGTMENLEGVPEARIVGFPIGLQAAGAIAGGVGTTGAILRNMETPIPNAQGVKRLSKPPVKARTVALAGAGGAVVGALAGKLANTMLASRGNPELPSTYQYDTAVNQHEQAVTNMLESGEINEQQYQAMLSEPYDAPWDSTGKQKVVRSGQKVFDAMTGEQII